MTATQTSVAFSLTGYAGQLADTGEFETRSYLSESATELPFGTLVVQGTAQDGATGPTAQSDVTYNKALGVIVHGHNYAKTTELGDNGLKQYATLKVMKEGNIKVWVTEAVAVTDAVRVRADTNAGAAADPLLGPGTFCKSSSAGHTCLFTKGARWMRAAGAGSIAILHLDVDSLTITND